MIARVTDDILFCDACSPRVNIMLANRMVGPGTAFEKACPHIEIAFLEWRKELRDKEGARFKDVWQPFVIGLLLGGSLACSFFPWGSIA